MLECYAELDFPFQASHRFLFVDKVTADTILDAKRKKHANKREGAKGFFGRVLTGDSGHKKNIAAAISATHQLREAAAKPVASTSDPKYSGLRV